MTFYAKMVFIKFISRGQQPEQSSVGELIAKQRKPIRERKERMKGRERERQEIREQQLIFFLQKTILFHIIFRATI